MEPIDKAAWDDCELRLGQIVEATPVAMFVLRADHTVTHWNRACVAMFGIEAEQMIGTRDTWRAFYDAPRPVLANLVLDGAGEDVVQSFYGSSVRASQGGGWEGVHNLPDGGRWFSFSASPLLDLDGRVAGAVETVVDITASKHSQFELEYRATHDAPTGLPNRFLLIDRLEQALRSAERSRRGVGVLYIGLSGVRLINESFGHPAGDQVLKEVALRLTHCVRGADTVARFSSDEFVILLTEQTTRESLVLLAERCIAAIGQPFHAQGHDNYLMPAVGMALFPEDGRGATHLLKGAASAMHRVKSRGRSGFQFFDGRLNDEAAEQVILRGALAKAVEKREFTLNFQPKIGLHDGRVSGVEALLRWTHPKLGQVSPARFIPMLEESGQIVEIGEWVIDQAVGQAGRLSRDLPVAVNLSMRQLWQADLPRRVESILARHGVAPARLELEITESMLMADADQVTKSLRVLDEMGVRLSIDDFGTGYSSLAYLKHFPIHSIKIDRSFIAELDAGAEDFEIVRAIVTLGRGLGRKIVAEGVETDRQRQILADLGCDEMQGYLLSPPLPADELDVFLKRR